MGDATGSGLRKIDELRNVVAALPPVPMIGFSDRAGYLDGYVPEPQGGTNLTAAIELAASRGVQHIGIISDGIPDSKAGALKAAQRFGGQIDVFYVGDPGGPGELFLMDLASRSNGRYQGFDLGKPKALTAAIKGLLGTGQALLPEKSAIQL
jgi:hypothetical protein